MTKIVPGSTEPAPDLIRGDSQWPANALANLAWIVGQARHDSL
jgi:hypothetical protein